MTEAERRGRSILIISAHPDDMEIGMGGTAAKMAAAGAVITSVVLTDGRRSPNPFSWPEEKMAAVRMEEARRAAGILGIHEVVSLGLPDLKNPEHYRLAKTRLTELFAQKTPVEIYTLHESYDRHSSHRLAGKLVTDCLKEQRLPSIRAVWAYEVWGLFPTWDRLEYIDAQMDKKLRAIAVHQSQLASVPYGEGVAGLNRWRAVFVEPHQEMVEGTFAEAFIKRIKD